MVGEKNEKKVISAAFKYFSDARPTHDWSHVLRVHALCMHIGLIEGADLKVLSFAAYLHDVGRCFEEKDISICHAEKGAEISKNILNSCGYDINFIDSVVHCVKTHRFRNNAVPLTLEAKILFDADKLDSIGAIGIARAYAYAGEHNQKLISDFDNTYDDAHYVDHSSHTPIKEYIVKLSKLKDRMMTSEGKRIAIERDAYMSDFYERLHLECNGDV